MEFDFSSALADNLMSGRRGRDDAQQLGHRIGCGLMTSPVNIGVGVRGDLNVLVAQNSADRGEWLASSKQPTCASVSKIVRRRLGVQLGRGHRAIPDRLFEQVVANRSTPFVREQPLL